MKQRIAGLVGIAVLAGGGCGVVNNADEPAPAAAATAAIGSALPTPREGGGRESGSVRDAGDIPDPCTLLSGAEVRALTGRGVTQVDPDGASAGDVARFCQWQQEGGQLALFLSRTTAEEFRVTVAEAETVDGVGEDAYWHSGHLYVLYGTVQVDVYSRGASDERNLAGAKKVAQKVIPRI